MSRRRKTPENVQRELTDAGTLLGFLVYAISDEGFEKTKTTLQQLIDRFSVKVETSK
jgi:hypothetical protein